MARASSTAYLGSLPVGFRFTPTDDELVNYYLKQKMMGYDHLDCIIPEVNIYKFEPWDLPQKSQIKSDDMEWYFLCPRVLRYANREQAKRTTIAGYWKGTGNGRKVRGAGSNELIAKTKILVFYLGRFPNGIKTNWVMHEFLPSFNLPQQKDYVICRLTKKRDKKPTVEDGESSPVISSDFENQIPDESHGTAMSEEDESVQIMIHPGSELQTPNENNGIPISDYCESNAITMASDFENQKATEVNYTPTIEETLDPIMASGFENQKATEVNYTPTIEETLDPIMASDFGNQNVTAVNYTPTTEGAPDPLRASDHPFDLPEEMWAYLEPFNGFDENDFNL